MSKILSSLLFVILIMTLTSCNKKPCPQGQAYHGLYNALTCNYESKIEKVEENLTSAKENNLKRFKKYLDLMSQVSSQEEILKEQKEYLSKNEKNLADIKENMLTMDTKMETKNLLKKIASQIHKMRKSIK